MYEIMLLIFICDKLRNTQEFLLIYNTKTKKFFVVEDFFLNIVLVFLVIVLSASFTIFINRLYNLEHCFLVSLFIIVITTIYLLILWFFVKFAHIRKFSVSEYQMEDLRDIVNKATFAAQESTGDFSTKLELIEKFLKKKLRIIEGE